MSEQIFQFHGRWKEELVVTAQGGSFVLDMPMGILSVYLPTRQAWEEVAPEWARQLWPDLKWELEEWCEAHDAQLYLDASAGIFPA